MNLVDKKVLIIGSGGSARSIIYSLAKAGVGEIAVINRTKKKALDALELAGSVARHVDKDKISEVAAEADLVVNATPIGMSGAGNTANFPIEPNYCQRVSMR